METDGQTCQVIKVVLSVVASSPMEKRRGRLCKIIGAGVLVT